MTNTSHLNDEPPALATKLASTKIMGHVALGTAGLALLLVFITGATWLLLGPTGSRTITVFLINIIAVVGIGIFTGNSGILSFGHLSFMGMGAFITGILTLSLATKALSLPNLPGFLSTLELGMPASFFVALTVSGLVAVAVGIPISRLRGTSAAISTLGLLVIVHGILIGARDYTRGAATFFGIPRETTLWIALFVAIVAIWIARLYRDTAPGIQLRAARDNEMAASAMGVDVESRKLIAWVISAVVVAASGVLYAHFLGTISPKQFYFINTLPLLAMLIVGGMMTVTGAVFGTILITVIVEVLRRLETGVVIGPIELPTVFGATQIGVSLIVMIVLYRWPLGILGRLEWDELWKPKRHNRSSHNSKGDMHSGTINENPAAKRQEKLMAKAVTKNFAGVVALNNVDLEISTGQIIGLIGPNGSGKTTLVNVLSGVIGATKGCIIIGDSDCTNAKPHIRARLGIGRTFQNIRMFTNLSVFENVLVGALSQWPKISRKAAEEHATETLIEMKLLDLASAQASTLSYGLQRRVEIARALALRPSFLLLDEPAAGMNPSESEALMHELADVHRKYGIGMLVIDHDLSLIMRLCERVVVLNKGEVIADGVPSEIQNNAAVIEAYLGRAYKSTHQ